MKKNDFLMKNKICNEKNYFSNDKKRFVMKKKKSMLSLHIDEFIGFKMEKFQIYLNANFLLYIGKKL